MSAATMVRTSRTRRNPRLAAGLLALLAAGCGLVGTSDPPPDDAARVAEGTRASVVHRDPRLGAPSFVWLRAPAADVARAPRLSDAGALAREMLPTVARAFELSPAAASALRVARVDDPGRGPVIARYAQRVGDVEVFRGGVSLVLSRALEPVAASGLVATTVAGAERPFVLDEEAALRVALGRTSTAGASITPVDLAPQGSRDGYAFFTAPGLAAPARAKRVLFPRRAEGATSLEPAFYVEVLVARGPSRSFVVSALDGAVLFANDLVKNDAFSYRVWADPESLSPLDGPQGEAFSPHPTGKPDRTKLSYVPSQLVTLASSPFSKNDPWLAPGATTTSGNNVDAYADLAGDDGFTSGDVRPELTGERAFDHLYDTAQSPDASTASRQASVTHLFYVLNYLHDAFYDAGFDEKAGNHQLSNLGRGGREGDPLLAEAQDQSGRNNANAAVPADGLSPRIQMFVFSGPSSAALVVDEPASLAGSKPVGIAPGFGDDVFDVSGPVVLAADGQGTDVADACEALENQVAGKIVLAHRGLCSFAQKAQNAQAAGALGLVVANVASSASPSVPPFMGGTASGITLPLLSLSYEDGQALEAALSSGGATVTMHRALGADLDGALDTSIVAHEWGHVLSSRLVGDANGLTTNQAGGLGEGWGDFVALLTLARSDGSAAPLGGVYANGTYATSGSGDDIYFGTRRVPYSVDFTKSPLTFKHIQNGVPLPTTAPISFGEDGSFNAEVHNTGEVWASMLWECYVALVRDGRYAFPDAQARMRRYLVASLAATPPDPTLLEARDALLAVAYATDPGDFTLFFEAFARRGAGAGAEGPPKDSANNVGVKESFSTGGALQIVSATLTDDVLTCDHDGILDEGEVGRVVLTLRNVGAKTLEGATVALAPKTEGVTLMDETVAKLPALAPFETTELALRTRVTGAKAAVPVDLEATLADPELAEPLRVVVSARYDADEAPGAAAVDRVETARTAWKTASPGEFGPARWSRMAEGKNVLWHVPNGLDPSDMRLTSPPFTIDGASFSLSFSHKWSFRFSRRRQAASDGGLLEYSVDAGKTWSDLSEVGAVDYNVTLDMGGRGDNVLRGRRAYGSASPGYPDQWVRSKIDVTLPEPPPSVMVRFRAGSGSGFYPTDGWFVDDIELSGVTSTPFYGFVPHADACDPEGPTADAGLPQTVRSRTPVTLAGSAAHPADLPVSFVWTQASGPSVPLRAADTATLGFDAPDVSEPTTLGFVLRANDGRLVSAASRVDVTVLPASASSGAEASCGCRAVGAGEGGASRAVSSALGAVALSLGAALRRRRPR